MSAEIINNHSFQEFWNWFETKEKEFFSILKDEDNVEENFLDVTLHKLKELNEQFFLFAGMHDDSTAELIITVDGNIKDIVYAQELVAASPTL